MAKSPESPQKKYKQNEFTREVMRELAVSYLAQMVEVFDCVDIRKDSLRTALEIRRGTMKEIPKMMMDLIDQGVGD